jgi:hypothetical protein
MMWGNETIEGCSHQDRSPGVKIGLSCQTIEDNQTIRTDPLPQKPNSEQQGVLDGQAEVALLAKDIIRPTICTTTKSMRYLDEPSRAALSKNRDDVAEDG